MTGSNSNGLKTSLNRKRQIQQAAVDFDQKHSIIFPMVTVIKQTNEWIDLEVDGHNMHLVLFETGEMDLFQGTHEAHDLIDDEVPESVFEQIQVWANTNLPQLNS
jgi:hypothetical protein